MRHCVYSNFYKQRNYYYTHPSLFSSLQCLKKKYSHPFCPHMASNYFKEILTSSFFCKKHLYLLNQQIFLFSTSWQGTTESNWEIRAPKWWGFLGKKLLLPFSHPLIHYEIANMMRLLPIINLVTYLGNNFIVGVYACGGS